MKILAGDIGGTKTILQVVEYGGGQYRLLTEQRFSSSEYESFERLLKEFINENKAISSNIEVACIGVAGPVKKHQSQVTNLPWRLNSESLSEEFGITRFTLINDFQAVGYGIARLQDHDLISLQTGERDDGHPVRSVIGAGTGLGHAILIWRDDIEDYQVLASEGGHGSFAPNNELQRELLKFLSNEFESVSQERVISGPGIENIFRFLNKKYQSKLGVELANSIQSEDVAPIIVEYGLQQKDPVAVQTLELFVDAYGAAAGNLALMSMSTGGVYIAGGIAPRISSLLSQGGFIRAFNKKSKMQDLLQNIPVNIINNPKVGLLGAANYAVHADALSI